VTGEQGMPPDRRRLHGIRNQLSVIIGYCDLLVTDIPADDPKHADIVEMRKAAYAAMQLLEGMREDS
jgi:hypothetical protein